jgi:hypothetical protein
MTDNTRASGSKRLVNLWQLQFASEHLAPQEWLRLWYAIILSMEYAFGSPGYTAEINELADMKTLWFERYWR